MIAARPLIAIGAIAALFMGFALHHIEEGHVGVYYRVCILNYSTEFLLYLMFFSHAL